MPQLNCPAQDGPLASDPYGEGVVACESCGCLYHRPCVQLFRDSGCAKCGTLPLRVHDRGLKSGTRELRSSQTRTKQNPTRPLTFTPGRIIKYSTRTSAHGSGCLLSAVALTMLCIALLLCLSMAKSKRRDGRSLTSCCDGRPSCSEFEGWCA